MTAKCPTVFGFARVSDLESTCDRLSFYGKCGVCVKLDGIDRNTYLQSYSTIVGYLDTNGAFHRTWSGYSSTTMRHINAFLKYFSIPGGGKKWWDALPVEALS